MMTEHRVRHAPVVTDDSLHGIVSIGDVLKSRITVRGGRIQPITECSWCCLPVHLA